MAESPKPQENNNENVVIRPLAMIMHYEEMQTLANVINETLAEEKK